LEILAGLIGAVIGGFISWVTTNARLRRELELLYDRELREKRVAAYSALWRKTKRVPRARLRGEVTGESLQAVREDWHNWYYDEGGIYMSVSVRDAYFAAAAALQTAADAASGRDVDDDEYARVYQRTKALRDALTADIGARVEPQVGSNRRFLRR
jgi:hypothetical protein